MTRSAETWSLLRRARLASVGLKEESITALHLLAFNEAGIEGFYVRAVGRQDERTIGADYELWFGDRGGRWLGMRVQAKRLDHQENFRDLIYLPKGSSIPQSRALLDSCRGLNLLPTYCLYVYSEAFLEPQHGCSLLSPLIVSAFPPNSKVTLEQVSRCLVPWTLLACTGRGGWHPVRPHRGLTHTILEGWTSAMGYGHQNRPRELDTNDDWQVFARQSFTTARPDMSWRSWKTAHWPMKVNCRKVIWAGSS
jgi:uncharacterized protein DUF6615